MPTTIQTSQLDFDTIKSKLKTYFERQSEFEDYDFEGSGLSNILDVLAYNTHFNALAANFALNEAYMDTAQLRASVISLAQTLGYTIRSKTSSRAVVNLSLDLTSAAIKPSTITLPSGTLFTTSVDDISYTFQTREAITATNDDGIYEFVSSDGSGNITLYEGSSKTKTFIVGETSERQVYVIPDVTIDTSTIDVRVYDSYNSSSYTSYTSFDDATEVTSASTHYRIVETPNGYYEISFGDGAIIGTKPTSGNKITVEYLSCVGEDANGATLFAPAAQVTVNSIQYDLSVNVVTSSYGGAEKQSLESIRQNAPLSFAAQKRLVTIEDYRTTILTKYSSVSDVAVWGGEDNVPANYGFVYIGLLYADGTSQTTKDVVQAGIENTLNKNMGIMSIDTKFVDPIISYLEITTDFSFDPKLTSLTVSGMESAVNSTVQTYVNNNLKTFTGTFRRSNLTAEIDNISDAILSSTMSIKVQQRLTPISGANTYNIYYPVSLAEPDDVFYRITTSRFYYDGEICLIRNKLSSNKLQIVNNIGDVKLDNVGEYTPSTGHILLQGFNPGANLSGNSYIKFTATPLKDNVIKPLRNYYLDLDTTVSFASATIDYQGTNVSL